MESKPFHISDYSMSCLLRALKFRVIAASALICALGLCLYGGCFQREPHSGSVTMAVMPGQTGTGTLSPGETTAVLSEMLSGPRVRREILASEPRLGRFSGTIEAAQVAATNYLVLSVQDSSPERVLLVLDAAVELAPGLAEYASPGCEVLVLREPRLRENSGAPVSLSGLFLLGALAGAMGMAVLQCLLYIARQTVQTPFGAQRALEATILAVVPRESRPPKLSAPDISPGFSAQIHNLCARIVHESATRGSKIFLFAGVGAGEGTTTLAANAAAALALAGNRVVLADDPDRLPASSEEYDYLILDAPPLDRCAYGELLAQKADASILVVGRDVTPAPEIRGQMDMLRGANARFLGVVLNGMSDPLPRHPKNAGSSPIRETEAAGKEVL